MTDSITSRKTSFFRFFFSSLYRNKSLYKVQIINPNKPSDVQSQTPLIEQNNADETVNPVDGMLTSLNY